MCFLSNSQFQTKDRGRVAVEKLTNQDILLGVDGKEYEIVDLYKLNEYKVIKMVRLLRGNLGCWKTIYLKPSQYLKIDDKLVTGKDLVEKFRIAEYERYNVLHFYLLNVKPVETSKETEDTVSSENVEKINCFLNINGLSMSVYNTKHPLNNRFGKYSLYKFGETTSV